VSSKITDKSAKIIPTIYNIVVRTNVHKCLFRQYSYKNRTKIYKSQYTELSHHRWAFKNCHWLLWSSTYKWNTFVHRTTPI